MNKTKTPRSKRKDGQRGQVELKILKAPRSDTRMAHSSDTPRKMKSRSFETNPTSDKVDFVRHSKPPTILGNFSAFTNNGTTFLVRCASAPNAPLLQIKSCGCEPFSLCRTSNSRSLPKRPKPALYSEQGGHVARPLLTRPPRFSSTQQAA